MSATESDISETLAANVDQLIADDFKPTGHFGGPKEFTIVSVSVKEGKPKKGEQPMSIALEGAPLPYKPCLTMRRLLAEAWQTKDARTWRGRRIRLYRDPNVRSPDGTKDAGGIRINGLSHITGRLEIRLTETRGSKKPWIVEPLVTAAPAAPAWTFGQIHPSWEADQPAFVADMAALGLTVEQIDQYLQSDDGAGFRKWWNGSDCVALGCSWVPTRWRAGLTDALKKKPDLVAKIAALKPSEPTTSQQGD